MHTHWFFSRVHIYSIISRILELVETDLNVRKINKIMLKNSKAFKFLIGTFAVMALAFAVNASAALDFGPTTLKVGSKGEYVKTLQAFVGAIPDGDFGPMTKAKVATWQGGCAGLVVDGVFGNMSKARANADCGTAMTGATYPAGCTSNMGFSTTTGMPCSVATSTVPGCTAGALFSSTTGQSCSGTTTGTLTGNAGSITVTALSTYGDEQVGENESDVKLAAFEVEADNGSDVSISSMKVELNQQNTADSEDMDDYMKSVSIWMGSTKVGDADASTFSESSTGHVWTKSVTLNNAVIKAGDTEKFYVAVTALANLDSGDMDSDDWQIGVSNIRFLDADGVVTTESLTLDIDDNTIDDTVEEEFDFASFATAGDVELKVALKTGSAAEAINEAHVINVESGTTDTDDVKVLNFTLKAEGSDLNVTEIPVLLTTTGETDEAVILIAAKLWHKGVEVASETVATGGAVTFDGLDIDINDGDTEEFTVTVDLQDLTGALDAGDTVEADLTATEVDAIVAEDESGEELAAADLTGTANGEASEVRDIGMIVEFVSASSTITHTGDPAGTNDHDQGKFKIVVDVTAFDGNVYLDGTAPTEAGTAEHDLSIAGAETLLGSIITTSTGATMTGTVNADARFLIEEDTTERFEISVTLAPTADGYFEVSMTDFIYALTDVTGDVAYTFNLEDFKTPQLYLNYDA